MKTLRILVPLLALLGSGCLKLNEAFTIREDGSATLELIYSISERAVAQTKAMLQVREQMAALSGEEAEAAVKEDYSELFLNPIDSQIRREMKKYEKFGIILERLKIETRDNWRHVELKLSCKNVADLQKMSFFSQYGFSLSKDEEGNYSFFRERETANADSSANLPDATTLKMMAPVLEGFNAVFRVNTPGKVLKTNAHIKTLRNVSWEFNYDRDPNTIMALQNQQFKIVFEGKTADGKAFTLPEVIQKRAAPQKAK